MVEIEKKLEELGLELPEVPMDMKNWSRCNRAGNFIFMGTTAAWPLINSGEKEKLLGKVGREISWDYAKEQCKMCALTMLSALKNELDDLDKIDKIVKLEVYINGIGGDANKYVDVADAASELFIELFGENGRATRTITPMNGITNIGIELDMVIYIKD